MNPTGAKPYLQLVDHYEACLERHGDTHLGVDWPRQNDAEVRYRVMLEVVRQPLTGPATLLDLGCGAAHMYEYLLRHPISKLSYMGLDISAKFIALCRQKFPDVPYPEPVLVPPPWEGGDGNSVNHPVKAPARAKAAT